MFAKLFKWGFLISAVQNVEAHEYNYAVYAVAIFTMWVLYDIARKPLPLEPVEVPEIKPQRRHDIKELAVEPKPAKVMSPRSEQEEKLAARFRAEGCSEEDIASALSNLGFKRTASVRRKGG